MKFGLKDGNILYIFICLYCFGNAYAAVVEEEQISQFIGKNPCTVQCFSPSMKEDFIKDNKGREIVSKQGKIGEDFLYKIFELYGNLKDNVMIFKSINHQGTGFDYVMVDKKETTIVFLEAKDTSAKAPDSPNDVMQRMQSALKDTSPDRTDQLSRRWCSNRLQDLRSIYPTEGEHFIAQNFGEDINYKFMRVANFTYIYNDPKTNVTSFSVYYSIIRDGNFNGDAELTAGSIDGAVSRKILFSDRELSVFSSEKYIHDIYSLVSKQTIEAILPFPKRVMRIHEERLARAVEGWSIESRNGLISTLEMAKKEYETDFGSLRIAEIAEKAIEEGGDANTVYKKIAQEEKITLKKVQKFHSDKDKLEKSCQILYSRFVELKKHLPTEQATDTQTYEDTMLSSDSQGQPENETHVLASSLFLSEGNDREVISSDASTPKRKIDNQQTPLPIIDVMTVKDTGNDDANSVLDDDEHHTPTKKVHYSESVQREAADELEKRRGERGAIAQIAQKRGISTKTLTAWHKKYYIQPVPLSSFIEPELKQEIIKESSSLPMLPLRDDAISVAQTLNNEHSSEVNNVGIEQSGLKKTYSEKFQREVAEEFEKRKGERGANAQISQKRGISAKTLTAWHKKYYPSLLVLSEINEEVEENR